MGFSLWCNIAEVLGTKTTEVTAVVKKKLNSYLLNISLNFQQPGEKINRETHPCQFFRSPKLSQLLIQSNNDYIILCNQEF